MQLDFNLIGQLMAILAGIAGGYYGLRRTIAKDAQAEVDRLIELKDQRVTELEARVDTLLSRVDKLSGELDAVRKMQTEKIIQGVVAELRPFLESV